MDSFNGGCDSDSPVFQDLIPPPGFFQLEFCGKSGWFDVGGQNRRDTDWFEVVALGSEITWSVEVEEWTECQVVSMSDCSDFSEVQMMIVDPYSTGTLVIETNPGELVHLIVKPGRTGRPLFRVRLPLAKKQKKLGEARRRSQCEPPCMTRRCTQA